MNPEQELTLWVGAFRYYLGRRTGAVGEFCSLLIENWQKLRDRTKTLIIDELDRAFIVDDQARDNPESYKTLGMKCDRAEWERVRALWQGKATARPIEQQFSWRKINDNKFCD